jgi:hypothetical protein
MDEPQQTAKQYLMSLSGADLTLKCDIAAIQPLLTKRQQDITNTAVQLVRDKFDPLVENTWYSRRWSVSYDQIARELNIAEGTVSSHVRKIEHRLFKMVKSIVGAEPQRAYRNYRETDEEYRRRNAPHDAWAQRHAKKEAQYLPWSRQFRATTLDLRFVEQEIYRKMYADEQEREEAWNKRARSNVASDFYTLSLSQSYDRTYDKDIKRPSQGRHLYNVSMRFTLPLTKEEVEVFGDAIGSCAPLQTFINETVRRIDGEVGAEQAAAAQAAAERESSDEQS